jgi:hypothetical protein|tara:strand:- start:36 stop:284 length:249 start_codon:yes stop_codon:yes gene_type:complete
MNLLEEVLYDGYKQRIEYAYYLTLIDILMGITTEEILSEMPEYERKEMYEFCEGIKRAIDFSEDKNYSEIQKEILKLKDRYE